MRSAKLTLKVSLRLAVCAFVFTYAAPVRAQEDAPAPLPPPPELLGGIRYEIGEPFLNARGAGERSPDMQRALEAPPVVTAESVPAQTYSASAPDMTAYYAPPPSAVSIEPQPVPAAAYQPQPGLGRMAISPPSRFMPTDYYDLPMVDEGIPGVLLPELDEDFVDPGMRADAPLGRPRSAGMTVRQLEPFFALAKGSESTAIEAKRRGDDATYADQIAKAIGAYMDIISMADAGNEAREEAWYGVARCEYRRSNWWRAFDALERSFPKQFERSEVAARIKLEMYIGERLWRMGDGPAPDAVVDGVQLSGYQAASRVYDKAIFNQPTAQDAPLALLRRGDAAAMEGDWKTAERLYRQVVTYYPESEPALQAGSSLTEAIYRQEWPAGFPEAARYDVASIMDDVERARPKLSGEAEERRQRVVSLANDREAEDKMRQAKSYLGKMRVKKSRDAAVFLLGDIVSYYPTTPQAAEAAELLRGMGIEPPMVLSDGSKFPLSAGWSGGDAGAGEAALENEFGGGLVRLEGQDDIRGGVLSPSPTRETVFEAPDMSLPGLPE